MKLGRLLFASFVAILVLCFSYPAVLVVKRLRIIYLESAEEPLVDTANVLAELVGRAMEREEFDVADLYGVARGVAARDVSARIYETMKARVDLDVYMTDARGVVIFDTRGKDTIGKDYSAWHDVRRALTGQYGARVKSQPGDMTMPKLLYVAAPIRVKGEIAGVLTVVKPTTATKAFLQAVRPRIMAVGAIAVGAAILLAFLVSWWVSRQVGRLTRYADQVREGRRVPFPDLAPTELRHMGLAFERMRASLAGHAYIEQYVRALTHEIKSPISAIRGAAEILERPTLDAAQREHFLQNIRIETQRTQDLVDRMLELSELEVRRGLPTSEPVALAALVRTIVEGHEPMLVRGGVRVEVEVADDLVVRGDAFLLHLALSNLIKNAGEFSPAGGAVRVRGARVGADVCVVVEDQGPGIPDYARERVFERFYSLERPATGRKSTGLGLNFVKEIAALHHGRVGVENRAEGGLRASFRVPVA